MSDRTRIQWCDSTWNPIVGCTPISAGCDHCYAARMAKRLAGRCGYPRDFSEVTYRGEMMTKEGPVIDQPMRWKRPRRIFTCSMGDLFHPDVSPKDRWRVFATMELCRNHGHTFLVLTKRPELISPSIEWPSNVWLGVTAENQEMADQRIPLLLKVKASVRFVSCEPLLGPLSIGSAIVLARRGDKPDGTEHDLSWVIVGGETGPGARPMHPDWVRSIRDQCVTAGVPFFFKQDGPKHGRLLDGREWSEIPEVSP